MAFTFFSHGSALVGSDPHELAPLYEVCQMKGTYILNHGVPEGATVSKNPSFSLTSRETHGQEKNLVRKKKFQLF